MRFVASLLSALGVLLGSIPAAAVEAVVPRVSVEAGLGSAAAPAASASAAFAPGLSPVLAAPALSARLRPSLSLSAAPSAAAAAPVAAALAAESSPEIPVPAVAAEAFASAPSPAAPAAVAAETGGELVSAPRADAAANAAPLAAPSAPTSPRVSRTMRFAASVARALLPWSRAAQDGGAAAAADPSRVAAPARLDAASASPAPRSAPAVESGFSERAGPTPSAGKSPFMAGTFVYNLATSVMLVVQQALFFTLAQQDQLARGVPAGQAGLHAAGIVFALATLTGAMRIPGNSLGAWLSGKTDQRNLALLSSGARAAILAVVGGLVLFHHMTLPLAAVLYSADWMIGGLEEVSRNTQTVALVKPGSAEFKSWSTLAQFLAQLTGLFGPLFVVVLAQFKGLGAAGHVLAPLLFGAAALLYARVPADAYHRASDAAPEARAPRLERWRAFLRDRALLLPVLALALLSTLLLKGPLSLNMASLLLGKTGSSLVAYSALLSGIFGAGLGAGSWLAHVQDATGPRHRSPARWLAVGALSTAALAASWAFGASPALALPAIAAAWFFFALANAAAQALLTHGLQERVAASGPDKKYVVGLSLTLGNVVITVLRVLAGLIFFVAAKNWETGFGLFGALLLLVALGQWLLSRGMAKGAAHVR
jgi:hypothetical protein